jgi:hypothetical protein
MNDRMNPIMPRIMSALWSWMLCAADKATTVQINILAVTMLFSFVNASSKHNNGKGVELLKSSL